MIIYNKKNRHIFSQNMKQNDINIMKKKVKMMAYICDLIKQKSKG